jgi:hypothetical protein
VAISKHKDDKELDARIESIKRKGDGLFSNDALIEEQIDKRIDELDEVDENEVKKSRVIALYIGAIGAFVGLFVFAILFYVGIFTVIFTGFSLYKTTKKTRYLIVSIAAVIIFIALETLKSLYGG